YDFDYGSIIDYERLCNGLWEMDVSNLVDFCLYDFSFHDKLDLLNLHMQLTRDIDNADFCEKLQRYYYSSLFKNMHMCGTLTMKLRQMESEESNVRCWNTYIAQGIDIAKQMTDQGLIGMKKNYSLTKLLNELRK
ncbi:hypothetical protein KY311_01035, partial [Candidatus Woesearchaeota archaeon]|nr:hypothetical protein [Candidatus Woesearchaeota archaeon]